VGSQYEYEFLFLILDEKEQNKPGYEVEHCTK